MKAEDFPILIFDHHFPEPEGHWACGVDVKIRVPPRPGATLREQLDGLTFQLPVDPRTLED
jgi:hypothetical protein